jgi:ABC-type transporter Mla subunit MlaD
MTFSFRVRFGEYEVELNGTRQEVLATVKDLPALVANVSKAFEQSRIKAAEYSAKPLTVRVAGASPNAAPSAPTVTSIPIPSISPTQQCSQAVLSLLETDWGRWRPRTLPEVIEALKVNKVHYPATTVSGVLNWLVKKGKVRRWKTEDGTVYILAEKEAR